MKTYKNCTAIRHVYSGGIAKKGVKYNTTHWRGHTYHRALKGNVKFSSALYNANKKSDADHDGIACEKS
ncbi:excalibur calcium-binding domain-containing protein [Amnibacterium kyonggiense]|uniref:excalibur calcium-binding domain-containing protein n=1 Tax=Amnibacterium kyonggiense TaxID=595671 RepID=UPI001FEB8222|nr:excalibur calcium-binding domain-containing protein [Amnibacterium kyonggiense]